MSSVLALATVLLIYFGLTSQVQAAKPVAKFKLLSLTGREEVTFQEQGTDFDGQPCAGTTEWNSSYRSTKPVKFYVFLKKIERQPATVLATEPKASKFEIVTVEGEATSSLRRDYSATAGCSREPEPVDECPRTPTGGASEVFLGGDFGDAGPGTVRGGVSGDIPGVFFYCTLPPLPLNGDDVEFEEGAFATVIPRQALLGKKKRVEGTATDVVELVDTATGPFEEATASGVYTQELTVSLKRLKLKGAK